MFIALVAGVVIGYVACALYGVKVHAEMAAEFAKVVDAYHRELALAKQKLAQAEVQIPKV